MEVTTSADALRRQRAALGGSGILQDAMSALQEAEVFGLDAAKRKLYAVIGRVQVDPIPTPDTDREKAIFKTVGSVCAEVFKWAQFAEILGKIAGLLQ